MDDSDGLCGHWGSVQGGGGESRPSQAFCHMRYPCRGEGCFRPAPLSFICERSASINRTLPTPTRCCGVVRVWFCLFAGSLSAAALNALYPCSPSLSGVSSCGVPGGRQVCERELGELVELVLVEEARWWRWRGRSRFAERERTRERGDSARGCCSSLPPFLRTAGERAGGRGRQWHWVAAGHCLPLLSGPLLSWLGGIVQASPAFRGVAGHAGAGAHTCWAAVCRRQIGRRSAVGIFIWRLRATARRAGYHLRGELSVRAIEESVVASEEGGGQV
ncbi:uncharacterized protein [Physcomitrium patens]|uniref:uncharacterized protein n=1 Tax=Physcomitrium patens TaxID=3218 RepID=UPI003CCDD60C